MNERINNVFQALAVLTVADMNSLPEYTASDLRCLYEQLERQIRTTPKRWRVVGFNDNKIGAIKELRERSGLCLAASKRVVEGVELTYYFTEKPNNLAYLLLEEINGDTHTGLVSL